MSADAHAQPLQRMARTVCSHLQVLEEIVRQGLVDIRAVDFETDEHYTSPDHDPVVNLPDKLVLFAPCPSCKWVKAVIILPGPN